jgi:hypothetical protein
MAKAKRKRMPYQGDEFHDRLIVVPEIFQSFLEIRHLGKNTTIKLDICIPFFFFHIPGGVVRGEYMHENVVLTHCLL